MQQLESQVGMRTIIANQCLLLHRVAEKVWYNTVTVYGKSLEGENFRDRRNAQPFVVKHSRFQSIAH